MSAAATRGDDLVAVAHVGNRGEAEMIQGLLEAGEIPSRVQRLGIDGPGLGIAWVDLKGGSHRVMVHADRFDEARALLAGSFAEEATESEPQGEHLARAFVRLIAWSAAGFAVMLAIFLLSRVL